MMYTTYSQKILKSMTCLNTNRNINIKMYGEREKKEMRQNSNNRSIMVKDIWVLYYRNFSE